MEYYSESNRPAVIPCESGDKIMKQYTEKIDKDGKKHLIEAGSTNVYEKIQASKEQSLIENIIRKYSVDVNIPTNITEEILDLSNMPDNFIDAYNLIQEAKEKFEKEPEQIRSEFNNSFEEYMVGATNGKLKNTYKKHYNSKNETEKAENKSQLELDIQEAQKRLDDLKNQEKGENE